MNLWSLYSNLLDKYFLRPVVWDYIIATIGFVVGSYLFESKIIYLPQSEHLLAVATDLSNISLTIAGFVLTLLTVLITFKSGNNVNTNSATAPVFELFFTTDLYFQTVKHLKNCVKSLVFVAVLGFLLKLAINEANYKYLLYFNICGLIILVLTLMRSLLILSKIIALQKQDG